MPYLGLPPFIPALTRKTTETITDSEILTRFQSSGKASDLLPLYERYAAFIYSVALKYLSTPQRAEDAGAELWSVLLEKLPRHEVTNFKSWLHTTVRNHCLMHLRKEKRDPLAQSATGLVQSDVFLHLKDNGGENQVDIRPLHHCLKQLREAQRRCIHLFYLSEGETYQTIATQLKLTIGQVRSHLQNGRRNLKICLESKANPTE